MFEAMIICIYLFVTAVTVGVAYLVDYFLFVLTKVTYRLGYVLAVSLLMSVLMPIGYLLLLFEQIGIVTFIIVKLIVRPLFKAYLYRKISKAPMRKVLMLSFFSELIVTALFVLIASRIV